MELKVAHGSALMSHTRTAALYSEITCFGSYAWLNNYHNTNANLCKMSTPTPTSVSFIYRFCSLNIKVSLHSLLPLSGILKSDPC